MGHAMRDDIHGFSTEAGGKKQVEPMSGMELVMFAGIDGIASIFSRL